MILLIITDIMSFIKKMFDHVTQTSLYTCIFRYTVAQVPTNSWWSLILDVKLREGNVVFIFWCLDEKFELNYVY